MSNYFKVDRGVFNHNLFAGQEFSKRDAWAWLMASACYQDHKTRIGGNTVVLKRGQLSYSLRYIAEKWLWSKSKTERFLGVLKTETMIEIENETWQMIITICNYAKYQDAEVDIETENLTKSGTVAGQHRDSSGTNKNTRKQEKKEKTEESKPPTPLGNLFEENDLFPEWLLPAKAEWDNWVKMRKSIPRCPFTDNAKKIAIRMLFELYKKGIPLKPLLEEAELKSWKSFYEHKPRFTTPPAPSRSPNFRANKTVVS